MGTSCTKSAQPSVVVFSPYLAGVPMDLVFTIQDPRLKDGDVMVTEMAGNVVFTAEGSSRSLRGRKVLLNDNGKTVISMQEKLTSGRSRWQAFTADKSGKKKLFSVRKASASRSETELEVFLAENRREEMCDFKITGSYGNRTCSINQGNSSIAQMNLEHNDANMREGKHLFSVHINGGIDYCFIVALLVILREIHSKKSTRVMIKIAKGVRVIAPVGAIISAVATIIHNANS